MRQDKLDDEEMMELESGNSKDEFSVDDVPDMEIDKAIHKEEERSVILQERKSREKLISELEIFREEIFPILRDFNGITITVDPKKLCKEASDCLKPIPKELANEFLKFIHAETAYLKSLETHIRISKLWGYVLGLSLFWFFMFYILIACLNFYKLNIPELKDLILSFGAIWILSLGIWIYLWYKLKFN